MKKFFSISVLFLFCSTWNSQAQVQTFKAPPKFLNLTQQDTNIKILSVNSGSNVLQWVDKNSLLTPVPTLQQVLTAGNGTFNKTLEMQNGSNDFSILTGYGFQAQNVITGQTKSVYLNNSMGLNIGDGLGRYSVLNNTNGLYLKTTTSGKYGSLKSDLITGTDKTFQFPNNSGTLALQETASNWTNLTLQNGATANSAKYRTKGDMVEIELYILRINSSFHAPFLTLPAGLGPTGLTDSLYCTGYNVTTSLPVLISIRSDGRMYTITNTNTDALVLTIQYKRF